MGQPPNGAHSGEGVRGKLSNIFWETAVKEARELIASSEKSGHEYVGVQRAKAIVEMEVERHQLRWRFQRPPVFTFTWKGDELTITEGVPDEAS